MRQEKTLLNFYREVLTSIGFFVDEEGYVYVGDGDDKVAVTDKGKWIVVPYKEQIDSSVVVSEGVVEVTKILFNPLNENYVKTDSVSLTRTKETIESRLSFGIAAAGQLLLTLAMTPTLHKNISLNLNKFLQLINTADAPNIKKLVDEKTIDQWLKIYANAQKTVNADFVKIFLKKGGSIDGTKYNRVGTLDSPIYDMIVDNGGETPVHGVKLKPKEFRMFKTMLEFLLPDLDLTTKTYKYGSNDSEAPGFNALMHIYIKTMGWINTILTDLKNVDQKTYEQAFTDISITENDIDTTIIFKKELVMIPSESETPAPAPVASPTQQLVAPAVHETKVTGIAAIPTIPSVSAQHMTPAPVAPMGMPAIGGMDLSRPLPLAGSMPTVNESSNGLDAIKRAISNSGVSQAPVFDYNTLVTQQAQQAQQMNYGVPMIGGMSNIGMHMTPQVMNANMNYGFGMGGNAYYQPNTIMR